MLSFTPGTFDRCADGEDEDDHSNRNEKHDSNNRVEQSTSEDHEKKEPNEPDCHDTVCNPVDSESCKTTRRPSLCEGGQRLGGGLLRFEDFLLELSIEFLV